MQIGIKESEGPTSLDPKLAPVLWFHNNYDQYVEESDDEDGEVSGDDEEVSDEDEFSATSDEDESIEETDDDGISDDDDSNDDEEESNEVNDTLLLYSISSQQLLANSGLDDLKDLFYWITPQVGGKFCTAFFSTVVTLDFSPNPTFDIVAVTLVQNSVYNFREIYLLESRGELFCLYFYPPGACSNKTVEISVYKLDIPTTAWVKVDTLGDRAFIINTRKGYGASVNAKEACLQENCIYFSRHRDKGLYVYSMERGTTAAINPSTDLVDDVAAQILMPAS
ncbi:hypothetical protein OsJ_29240 [Oryza sativa Japonica Group]|uniref:KIB1-4 beta-propeller domain-containing protein n=2 Tax=Oryza TaxID=4527 RepID=Q6H413_ORYSJ|nr:hypothetical protein OsJ_29240 [Oryza sativa Japonica Group]BAD26536.1 hypothetical protein [Oryza sativa Japonica Group]